MFYSKSKRGFYDAETHGDNVPADAVEISAEQYAALLDGQSAGKIIMAGADGVPFLADPAPLSGNALIFQQIAAMEATITPRRMREAALGTDGGWLKTVDVEITALRKTLT